MATNEKATEGKVKAINDKPIQERPPQQVVNQINNDGGGAFFTQGIPSFFGFNVKNENDYKKEKEQVKQPF